MEYSRSTIYGFRPFEPGDVLPYVDLRLQVHVHKLSAGGFCTCAILNSMGRLVVKSWGLGQQGQSGYWYKVNKGIHLNQMGVVLPDVDSALPVCQSLAMGDCRAAW